MAMRSNKAGFVGPRRAFIFVEIGEQPRRFQRVDLADHAIFFLGRKQRAGIFAEVVEQARRACLADQPRAYPKPMRHRVRAVGA